jgi:cyclic pyranopterin phosphate synthase
MTMNERARKRHPEVYGFEEIGKDLPLLPLAARRALDNAGIKLSLAAWQSMKTPARRALVRAGSAARVDTAAVERTVAGAGVASSCIPKVIEPGAVPAELRAAVDEKGWRALSALDRYALAKLSKKGAARLARATAEIIGANGSWSPHLSTEGNVHMVGVGAKEVTARRAIAHARVTMKPGTFTLLLRGETPKGDALATVRVAGIQAAKRTSELIPLCHAVALTKVEVIVRLENGCADIEAIAEALDRTGVEMEAMVAASTAALTLYDMLKGIDRSVTFSVALREKSGGRSGTWKADGGGAS